MSRGFKMQHSKRLILGYGIIIGLSVGGMFTSSWYGIPILVAIWRLSEVMKEE
jgi:hypothetical protein